MKRILWILLFTQIVWGNESCNFDTKSLEKELSKLYKRNASVRNSTKIQSKCEVFDTNNLLVVSHYTNDESTACDGFSDEGVVIVSMLDLKSKKRIFSKKIYLLEKEKFSIKSIKTYPFNRFSITLSVSTNKDIYGGEHRLFLYEFKNKKINKLLSNFVVKSWNEELEYESFSSVFEYTLESSSLNNESHIPLIFKKNYKFSYSNEYEQKKPIDENWEVELEPVSLIYNEKDKLYENVKKEKALFELKEIEENTKKGWRYKKVVLQAMLYNKPVSIKNIKTYEAIAKNLLASGHKKEGNFLFQVLNSIFPNRGRSFKSGFKIEHRMVQDVEDLLLDKVGVAKPKNILPWKQKTLLTWQDVSEELEKVIAYKKDGKMEFVFFTSSTVNNHSTIRLYGFDSYTQSSYFIDKVEDSYVDFNRHYFTVEDGYVYLGWVDGCIFGSKDTPHYQFRYKLGENKKIEPFVLDIKKEDSPSCIYKFFNHAKNKFIRTGLGILGLGDKNEETKEFEIKNTLRDVTWSKEKADFEIGDISWAEDDEVIYFDNYVLNIACIWRYNTRTKELSKIVPEHEAKQPFAFSFEGEEYVVYIEENKIKVATEVKNIWDKKPMFDADSVVDKLEKQYEETLKDYTEYDYNFYPKFLSSFTSKENENNEVIIVKPYVLKNKKSAIHSLLVAVVNTKNNMIMQSYFHKDAIKFSYSSMVCKFDRKSYKGISSKKPFAISIQEILDGPPTDTRTHLFLYEAEGKALKPILSNLVVEESSEEMGSQSKNRVATLKKYKTNSNYPPLVYKQKYEYTYEASNYKDEPEWKVNLDDIVCTYKGNKYECKQNPIFDLKQIAQNLKKGLKYKEIVLRAMLWETKITKENVDDAEALVSYLLKHKIDTNIAKILLKRIDSLELPKGFKEIHKKVQTIAPLLLRNKGMSKPMDSVPWLQKTLVEFKGEKILRVISYEKDGTLGFVFFALVKEDDYHASVNVYGINQKEKSYFLIKAYPFTSTKKMKGTVYDWCKDGRNYVGDECGFNPYYFYYKDGTIYFNPNLIESPKSFPYQFNPSYQEKPAKITQNFTNKHYYANQSNDYVDYDMVLVRGNKKEELFTTEFFEHEYSIGGFTWSKDNSSIYFDNHKIWGMACIWKYDVDTHELRKIVPEHEAEEPFAFTYDEKEYVVYIEGNKIKVATEKVD